MTRLEMLKSELNQLKEFSCISFNLRSELIRYYEHEIVCEEENNG